MPAPVSRQRGYFLSHTLNRRTSPPILIFPARSGNCFTPCFMDGADDISNSTDAVEYTVSATNASRRFYRVVSQP